MKSKKSLVWIDLEMTGLNPETDVILEIATVITNSQLTVLDEHPSLIIHQPNEKLDAMEQWVKDTHKASGLTDAVKQSTITLQEAEEQTLKFIQQYCAPQTALLCGNSVWQDRRFLVKYMPSIIEFLYYRMIDVTSIKELVQRWYPKNPYAIYEKKEVHRAQDDIYDSINELAYYREHFFIDQLEQK